MQDCPSDRVVYAPGYRYREDRSEACADFCSITGSLSHRDFDLVGHDLITPRLAVIAISGRPQKLARYPALWPLWSRFRPVKVVVAEAAFGAVAGNKQILFFAF